MVNTLTCTVLLMLLASPALTRTVPVHPDDPQGVTQVDFVFDNNVRKTRDLPTSSLQAARRKMISGAEMRPTELQALADAGDGLAAFRFGKYLQEKGEPDPTGVVAHYYAIAAYTGRAFAVPPLAKLLRTDGAGYSASRLKNGLNALTVQALSGNTVAATQLGTMYAEGVPFGYDLAKAESYLDLSGGGDGNPKAILKLGTALLSDPADLAAGSPGARSALTLAAAGDDLSVRVTAENLLRILDAQPPQADPAAALEIPVSGPANPVVTEPGLAEPDPTKPEVTE